MFRVRLSGDNKDGVVIGGCFYVEIGRSMVWGDEWVCVEFCCGDFFSLFVYRL